MLNMCRREQVDPTHAAAVVGGFLERLNRPAQDTFSAAQAAELMRLLGYNCSPRTLTEFVEKKYLPDFEVWDAVAVYCLAGALEARRRWQPAPSPHDTKKTGLRLRIEQLQAQGIVPIHDLGDLTIEDALLQICQSDSRNEREALYEVLRLKLAGFEE
jgi:hypothetical protein